MKKYLMTGMAALAICAAFTSCSKETNVYNPDVIKENTVQEIYKNYNDAFIKTFGRVAEGHQWGFVDYSKAGTRAHTYMNGNMEKYYNAPLKGANEEKDVEAYVHSLTVLPAKAAPDWQNYFVTQIHDGNETYNTQKSVDNTNTYVGGQQMDELAIAMVADAVINADGSLQKNKDDDWIHINNFNNANNTDWNGNTLVEEGGTFDFAYKSSVDSKYHNRWIGIDGKDVPNAQGQLGDYDDYYYICFDFEARGSEAKTKFHVNVKSPFRDENLSFEVEISGGYRNATEIYESGYTSYTGQVLNPTTNQYEEYTWKNLTEDNIQWNSVENGNMFVNGNNDYTDWIIRLYKAKEKNEEPAEWDLRIICEDLNATAEEGDPEDSDWDFNDLVLDVKFLGSDKVKMRVYAAGATLPIRINGEDALEVHGLYDQPTNMMINTGAAAAGYPSQAYESNGVYPEFERTITGVDDAYGANIKIEVEKGAGNWVALTAKAGEPASKMGVLPDFTPCSERQDIKGRYSNFVAWVAKQNPVYWWRPASNN